MLTAGMKHYSRIRLIKPLFQGQTSDLQSRYVIKRSAAVSSAKDGECQVHGGAVRSHATRWVLFVWHYPSLLFDGHIIYCAEIKDIGE